LPWVPAFVVAVVCTVILVEFDTPLSSVLLFAGYWAVSTALPGTLMWRMLRIRPLTTLEDLAAGTALGVGVQVFLTYGLARVGLSPRLAVVWYAAVIVACIVVPGLRRCWRSAPTRTVPAWMSWALSVTAIGVVWWTANTGFRVDPIQRVPGFANQFFAPNPYQDMPFHQALAASVLRGGVGYPFIPSVPLRYTMMAYEQMADFTRWTGVDLTLTVMRLFPVPLLVLTVVLCGVIAHRIANSAAAGALGGVLGMFTGPATLYRTVESPFGGVATLNLGVYRSPTQTFGEPLFLVLLLLIVVLIRERSSITARSLIAVALLAFVASGAKTTFLPMVACGLVLALVVSWISRARKTWTLLTLIAITVLAFLASLRIVTGMGSRGLEISNGTDLLGRIPVTAALGPIVPDVGVRTAAISLVVFMWILGTVGAVAAVVLRRRDLGVWLFAGIGISGMGAAIIGSHGGLSQIYFLRSAWPVMGVLAAVGFAELGKRAGRGRAKWLATVAALLAGLALTLGIRHWSVLPHHYVDFLTSYRALVKPLVILAVITVVIAAVVWLALRKRKKLTGGQALAFAVLIGAGLLQGASFSNVAVHGLLPLPPATVGEGAPAVAIGADGAEAARWIRAHSSPTDIIATNAHCLVVTHLHGGCIPRNFWISALSERNVLIEGWSYAAPSTQVAPHYTDPGPFWNPGFLAANDFSIYHPTAASVAWLKSQSVRFVLVDRTWKPESPDLKHYLDLVFERGGYAVYRVP